MQSNQLHQHMSATAQRLKLQELTEAQLAPLEEQLTPQWPETWRDFAYSLYCTLLSMPLAVPGVSAADLAVRLVHGIAKDMGGTQPYIPNGNAVAINANKAKALALLDKGYSYKAAADMCGLTASRLRNLERERRHTPPHRNLTQGKTGPTKPRPLTAMSCDSESDVSHLPPEIARVNDERHSLHACSGDD